MENQKKLVHWVSSNRINNGGHNGYYAYRVNPQTGEAERDSTGQLISGMLLEMR